MVTVHQLSGLNWRLTGWTPHIWRQSSSMETGSTAQAEVPPVPVAVPGSVQNALRGAGVIPDWNHGLNARECEWVENRHWAFETGIPDEWLAPGMEVKLNALGLDDRGWVFLNGHEVAAFKGSFTPHVIDLTPHLKTTDNKLAIIFDCPPRWLGQCGYTSRITDWRPRFNYTWDWTSRLVQIGIWDSITLELSDSGRIGAVKTTTRADHFGVALDVQARGPDGFDGSVLISLSHDGLAVRGVECKPEALSSGVTLTGLAVERWWPNGEGAQTLYDLRIELRDASGVLHDAHERRLGFRDVQWRACEGAPQAADPWICIVNGVAVFQQGVNWTPIRPNFADVTESDYRVRLTLYRDLGMNTLRVWGGAFLEKECFYDLCDELGLMVWQEFPLSSSGLDNWPPEAEDAVDEMVLIARSYIARRSHHACLILWSGGNELQGGLDGGREGCGKPCDIQHPMLKRLAGAVATDDPGRRFVATSASGPRFTADESEFGLGVHWDVHGPWNADGELADGWSRYWAKDDALFRSEAGAPGASPVDIIRAYKGELDAMPANEGNPLWRRTAWWIEWPLFVALIGREPADLEEYVAWSQHRQAEALATAARTCKQRFPRCGGILVWMGHDAFPCSANTSIVDFHGRPKPAALALAEVFLKP